MKKKILSVLLCAVLVLGLMPAGIAQAANTLPSNTVGIAANTTVNGDIYGETSFGYRFTLGSDGYISVDYNRPDSQQYLDNSCSWTVELWDGKLNTVTSYTYSHGGPASNTTPHIGLAAGTYYLVIHGTASSEHIPFSFKVNYTADGYWEKELNSSTPNPIALDTAVSGSLMYAGDIDLYEINVPDGGYHIYLWHDFVGTADTVWQVQITGSGFTRTMYFHGNEQTTELGGTVGLRAGTYQIMVRSGNQYSSGDYSLTVNGPDGRYENEPNDNEGLANELNDTVRGTQDDSDGGDYYWFYVTDDGGAVQLNVNADAVLMDTRYGWQLPFSGTSPQVGLRAGKYYVAVRPTGDYELSLQRVGSEYEWECNDSFGLATPLSGTNDTVQGGSRLGSIMQSSDKDYYLFYWNEDTGALVNFDYTVDQTSSAGWTVTVYDARANAIASQSYAQSQAGGAMLGGLGLTPGELYYISVVPNGFTPANYSLSVTSDGRPWEHEANDEMSAATQIYSGMTRYGHLMSSDDKDYFLFYMEQPGTACLTFTHPDLGLGATQYYWVVELLDENGSYMTGRSYVGSGSGGTWDLVGLDAGVYYVKINRNNSSYVDSGVYSLGLAVDYRPDWENEVNDAYANARQLPRDTDIWGTIMRSSEKDYYTFTLDDPAGVFVRLNHTQTAGASASWTVELQNSSHQTLTSWQYNAADESYDSMAGIGLPPDTYYVIVTGSGDLAGLRAVPYALQAYVDDLTPWETELNDTQAAASALNLNGPTRGSLMHSSDTDYYRLDLGMDSQVTLAFRHPNLGIDVTAYYWSVQLLDSNGDYLTGRSYTGKGPDGDWLSNGATDPEVAWGPVGLKAGTYYVKVAHNNTSYHSNLVYTIGCAVNYTNDWEAERNDDYDTARQVAVDTDVNGTIMRTNEKDYYTFDMAASGGIQVQFCHEQKTDSGASWTVELQDSDHETLTTWTYNAADENPDMSEECVGLNKGTYYIIVTGSGTLADLQTVPYTLQAHLDTSTLWEQEFNSLALLATPLPFDETMRGNLMHSSDTDYYKVVVDDDGFFRLAFTHPDLGVDATQYYWVVELLDGSGNYMAGKSYTGKGTGSEWDEIGLQHGTYYVRVKHNSTSYHSPRVYSLELTWSDAVPWEQERNDDYDTATPIRLNYITGGNLMRSGDVDYFSFTLDQPGGIFLHLHHAVVENSTLGWTMEVLNSDHEVVATRTVTQGSANVFNDYDGFGLPAGDYFLRITAGGYTSAPYELQVDHNTAAWEREFNNSMDTASPLGLGADTYGSFTDSSDTDYYKVVLPAKGGLTLHFTHPDLGVDATQYYWGVELWDGSGEYLTGVNYTGKGTGSDWSTVGLAAGTYYVRVNHNNTSYHSSGIYTLRADLDRTNAWEAERNNSFATATDIALNTRVGGNNMTSNDADYYRFRVTDNGYVTLRFNHDAVSGTSTYWNFTLYDDEENLLTSGYCQGNSPADLTTQGIGLTPGTYYVKVEPNSHTKVNYYLEVMFSNEGLWEKEKNNTFGTASTLPLNQTMHGNLMTYSDKDYYAFQITQPGYVNLSFSHLKVDSSSTYWVASICDAENNELLHYTYNGKTESVQSQGLGLPVGRYYVVVMVNNTNYHSDFVYQLTARFTAADDWETEVNGSRATADLIVPNVPVHGSLMKNSDEDYYAFTLDGDDSVALTFQHSYLDTTSNVWAITLMNESGSTLMTLSSKGTTTAVQTSSVQELSAGTYYVKVSGSSDLPYTLTVRTYGASLARIETQPQDAHGAYGQSVTFTVGATGTGLKYQWQYSANNGQTWRPTGTNANSLRRAVTVANDGWLFRCTVTDAWGNAVTSGEARLVLDRAAMTITTEPEDFTGDRDDLATFNVAASGDLVRYQWEYSVNGGATWRPTGGDVTQITCRVSQATDGRLYRCVVTDIYENTAVSRQAMVILNKTPLTIVSQPADYTGPVGDIAAFTVTATGEELIYQWEYSADGGATWKTTGGNAATVTRKITQAADGWLFRCTVTDVYDVSVTTDPARLTVSGQALAITGQPEDYTGAVGETATFTVEAVGDGLAYQWQYTTDGATWKMSTLTGNKTATLSVPVTAARNGYQYRCVVTDASGNTETSAAATLHVKTPLAITSQPEDYTGAVGETARFTVKATGDDLTYQWQYKSATGTTWSNSGQTGSKTATLSVPVTAARNGQQYRCVVTDRNGDKVISAAATLRVQASAAPVITGQPEDYTGAVGETARFTVKATGDGLTYQWQFSADGVTWKKSTLSGYNTATMSVPVTKARNGYQYRCVITNASGTAVTSEAATLHVKTPLAITGQPADCTAAVGETVKFTVKATGDGLTYQWQFSADGTTWKNSTMTGYKTATMSVPVTKARNGYQYRCVITDASGATVTSDAATLTVG